MQATDAQRLTDEYRRLVDGFQGQGIIPRNNDGWLANPALPDDILREAVRWSQESGCCQGSHKPMIMSAHRHFMLLLVGLSIVSLLCM